MQSSSCVPLETFSNLTLEGSILMAIITDQTQLRYHPSSPPQSSDDVNGDVNSATQLKNGADTMELT